MPKKRIAVEDIDVPEFAKEVEGGYPTAAWVDAEGDMQVHIYAPILPSPRPRVTSRGTFMPSDYRKHCDKLSCSLAYARGWYEAQREQPWPAERLMSVKMTFFSPAPSGDCDNLAKTILDAGQLHRGDEPGAELWKNDSQVWELRVSKLHSGEEQSYLTMLRITVLPEEAV